MVERWSEDRVKDENKFSDALEFKDKLWRLSYNYLKTKPIICKIADVSSGFLMTDKDHSDKIHKAQLFLKTLFLGKNKSLV